MRLYPIHKEDFFTSLFEKNKVSDVIDSIYFLDNREQIFTNKDKNLENPTLYSLELVPDYLVLKISKSLVVKKVFQKKGYGINLSNFSSAEDYLKAAGNANLKKNVIRCKNRLETCFNIRYTMFYGHIRSEEYHMLMGCLHTMITKRFQQRRGRNRVLENWDYYLKTVIHLINSKKASLFVIYNMEEPIELSLNFHFNNIMYSAISSYNMEYSKFSLGNIEIYKQLDWCLSNEIVFFDMGYGDLDYKKRWSNLTYNFETHIVSKEKSAISMLTRLFIKKKYQLINYVIKKGLNNHINTLKALLKNEKPNKKLKQISFKTELVNLSDIDLKSSENLTEQLNYSLNFLKNPVYDFLYSNNEHIGNISIYRIHNQKNTYLIKGARSQLKIIVI